MMRRARAFRKLGVQRPTRSLSWLSGHAMRRMGRAQRNPAHTHAEVAECPCALPYPTRPSETRSPSLATVSIWITIQKSLRVPLERSPRC